MRLGPTYLLIALLSLATCRAQGQSPLLDMNVRIQSPETTVKAYLQALGAAGNFSFSYGRAVPAERMVAPESRELTVRQHLVKLFHKDSLTWVERGNKILILPSEKGKANTSPMQTIRGQVVDAETNAAIGGANLLLHSDGPARGTSSDAGGYFRFDKVEVGRHEIQCSFVGYEPGARAIQVNAGKESILHIPLKEARYEIDELEINSRRAIAAPLNPIAVVSGRSFSAYEVENYPGSISDISRAARRACRINPYEKSSSRSISRMSMIFDHPVRHGTVCDDLNGTVVHLELLLTDFIGAMIMHIAIYTSYGFDVGRDGSDVVRNQQDGHILIQCFQ